MTQKQYNNVVKFYWVAAFINNRAAISNNFRFSPDKPPPVPNTDMDWYRPTFDELLKYNDRLLLRISQK